MSTEVTDLMENAELDVWAGIYAEARIAELIDIPFSEFCLNPWFFMTQADQETAIDCLINGFKPLLPKQLEVAAKIQSKWDAEDKAASTKPRHLTLVSSR